MTGHGDARMANSAEISFAAYWELSRLNASALKEQRTRERTSVEKMRCSPRHATLRRETRELFTLAPRLVFPSRFSPPSFSFLLFFSFLLPSFFLPLRSPSSFATTVDIDIFPRRRVSFSPRPTLIRAQSSEFKGETTAAAFISSSSSFSITHDHGSSSHGKWKYFLYFELQLVIEVSFPFFFFFLHTALNGNDTATAIRWSLGDLVLKSKWRREFEWVFASVCRVLEILFAVELDFSWEFIRGNFFTIWIHEFIECNKIG